MRGGGAQQVRRAGVGLAVAVGAVAASACGGGQAAAAPYANREAPESPVAIRAEGLVLTAPGGTVTVGAESGGRVVSVRVVEGDRVQQGDVLATFDDTEERAALDAARAQLAEGEAQLAFLALHYDRVDTLVRAGHVSTEELDVVTRDRAVARANVQAAEATVARLTSVLAKRTVLAPLAGRVVARTVEPGQMVAAGAPLFVVTDLGRRRVEAEVDESDIARVRVGAAVTITADGYEDRAWAGRVTDIGEQVLPSRLRPEDPSRPSDTRVILVKVQVPPAAPFKLGQRVELRISVQPSQLRGVQAGTGSR